MRTKTVTKLVRNLTPDEYQKCKNLNFRYEGCMMYDLPRVRRQQPKDAKVVMIKEAESGKLIAWCLAYRNASGQYETQYYTRVAYRQKGYGSRLMRHVKKFADKPVVMPHDYRSRKFFQKYENSVVVNSQYNLY
ncbi:acetyltransferase [Streptomyces phage Tomas]|uniref:Acetyltransferase n=1 Tax=Streptomyces phage Tomas TaxID=2914443 RepID=A0AA49H113_9CAUD|nr:acetyltransferase [Streptomyces phage Tomas]UMO76339.1 acetyltransferase [Streptomyces phage Tomas]